jgi:hypothetical protein
MACAMLKDPVRGLQGAEREKHRYSVPPYRLALMPSIFLREYQTSSDLSRNRISHKLQNAIGYIMLSLSPSISQNNPENPKQSVDQLEQSTK